jgi:hypothetical protein
MNRKYNLGFVRLVSWAGLTTVSMTLLIGMSGGISPAQGEAWSALSPTEVRLRLAAERKALNSLSAPALTGSGRALLPEERKKFQAAVCGPTFIENKGQ